LIPFARARRSLSPPDDENEVARPFGRLPKPLRLVIESAHQTPKVQLEKGERDLKRQGLRTVVDVVTRVLQRPIALTAVIWENRRLGVRPRRSLLAHDHR
jgi:hypothetical protein